MAKITKRTVDALKPKPGRDAFLWDGELKGFGVRMKPSGAAAFLIQYRNAEGRTRRQVIGKVGTLTPDEARTLAIAKLAAVAKGGDPAEDRQVDRASMTVEQLCTRYIEATKKGLIMGKHRRPKKASTLATDCGRIKRHIVPLLGRRKVKDLTTPDINRFMRDVAAGKTAADVKTGFRGRAIVEGGAGTAARTVGLLGGILSYAVSEGIIAHNPARGVKRKADERRRVRLTKEQYKVLGDALVEAEARAERREAITAIRLIALTGCRRGEIERLRWSEVDIDGRCLRLVDSKEGATVRPLGSPAITILEKLPRDGVYVLPGRDIKKHFVGLPKAWVRITGNVRALAGLTPHGLRHAFASIANDLGYSEPTIAALLGHAAAGVTQRYIHALDSALLAAADRVARTIERYMTGAEVGAVVKFPAAAG